MLNFVIFIHTLRLNRHELLTLKHYGRKVLHFMRTRKIEAAWHQFLQQPPEELSLLEGAVLMSKWCQLDQEEIPSMTAISHSIDEIVERVNELVSNCSVKSPRRTIAFINQVLFDERDFHGIAKEDLNMDIYYIDKVGVQIFING